MRLGLAALLAISIAVGTENRVEGATPTMEELDVSREWIATHFESSGTAPPFSFRYDGQPMSEALLEWRTDSVARKLDDSRIERTLTYTDSKTGLEVRCVVTEYSDYPAVEWVVFFENRGNDTTPSYFRGSSGRFLRLKHGHRGTSSSITRTEVTLIRRIFTLAPQN